MILVENADYNTKIAETEKKFMILINTLLHKNLIS